MRKTVVATVAVIVFGLIASLVWQYTHRLPPEFPRDHGLVKLFYSHQETFETLAHMGGEDAKIAWNNKTESLSVTCRSEYSELLWQIDSRIWITFDPTRIVFWCAGAGGGIGPSWVKGIAYLPAGPSRAGQIVKNLDKDPGHDGVYLVRIERDWYVIYQRDDYDRGKAM
jgi:hypothetical protein